MRVRTTMRPTAVFKTILPHNPGSLPAITNGLYFACYIPLCAIISFPNLPNHHVSLILPLLSNTQIAFTPTLTPADSFLFFPFCILRIQSSIFHLLYILLKAEGLFRIMKCTHSAENALKLLQPLCSEQKQHKTHKPRRHNDSCK
jgi:hypothetical protein